MKKNIFLLFSLLLLSAAHTAAGEEIKVYLDQQLGNCKMSEAASYLLCEKVGDLYKATDYSMDGKLVFTGFITSPDSEFAISRQKHFVYYDAKKRKEKEGDFVNGHRDGTWDFYKPAKGTIYKKVDYVMDAVKKVVDYDDDGTLGSMEEVHADGRSSFRRYENGHLMRETAVNGQQTVYYVSGNIASVEQYKDGKLVSGKYFDDNGKEIAKPKTDSMYRFVQQMPAAGYNLGKYLSENITYPNYARENNIEGRVIVKFIVMDDGTIFDPFVVHSVHPILDEEALRVIAGMPAWKPGMQNGKPVKCYFNQPLSFKLK